MGTPGEKRRLEVWDMGYAPKTGLEDSTGGRARRRAVVLPLRLS